MKRRMALTLAGAMAVVSMSGSVFADETTTIKMITWSNAGTVDALKELNEKFTEETGIEVELTEVPSGDYESLLNTRLAANDVDIFCYTTDSRAFAQPVVDWAPTEPLTWDEFIELCEAIKETGMAPLTVGGGDTWPVQMSSNAIVHTVEEGEEAALAEGLWKGTRTYTDEKSLKVFEREIQFPSYMEDGYMGVAYSDVPARLVAEKAAMLYDGSWNAAQIESVDPDFEYGFFALPGDNINNSNGKFDLTFGINFTHQRAHWVENTDYELQYPGSMADYQEKSSHLEQEKGGHIFTTKFSSLGTDYFRESFSEALKTAEKYQVPLYCGEFGVIDRAPAEDSLRWLTDLTAVLREYGIGKAIWSYKEMNFGISDGHYASVLEEILKLITDEA